MVECKERQRLTDLWHNCAKEYDRCVVAVEKANKGADYVDALRKYEDACLAMEKAHTMLQTHVADHGC